MQFELVSREQYDADVVVASNQFIQPEEFTPYDELRLPERQTRHSAGYDFYSPISFTLGCGETIKIPTFVKADLDLNKCLMIYPRSSIGCRYKCTLDNTVGVIDSDYYNNSTNEGHIWIQITNHLTNGETMTINAGDRIAQGIVTLFYIMDGDSFNEGVYRQGGFGSTN